MSEEKDKKEEKKDAPVEWGTRDEKLGETVVSGYTLEKTKDSKRKR